MADIFCGITNVDSEFLLHTFFVNRRTSEASGPSSALKCSERPFCTDCEALWQNSLWHWPVVPKELFTAKRNKPSSVPYLISEGQTPCPTAPPLWVWRNCLPQTGSNQTYQGDYWCSALDSLKQTLHQRQMTCKKNWSRKQLKETLMEPKMQLQNVQIWIYMELSHFRFPLGEKQSIYIFL